MSSDKKKVQKYCSIFNWISDHDEMFAEVMVELCLKDIANTTGKYPSITFLMPKGKFRDEIIEMAYSNTPEKAVDSIISLVIPYGFPTVESFNKALPTQIGNKLRFVFPEIIDKNSKSVNFGGKLVIKPASNKLVPRDKYNIYVWDIESGQPPSNVNKYVAKQEYIIPEGSRQIKGAHECATDTITQLSKNYRAIFAQSVEEIARSDINKIYTKNVYLPIVVLLLKELITKDNYQLFIKVRSVLDIDPFITFYLLLEPYKLVGERLISDDIFTKKLLDSILVNYKNVQDVVNEYQRILNKQIKSSASAFNKTTELIDAINELRNKLLNDVDSRSLAEELIKVYKNLEDKNEIKGVSAKSVVIPNVFPNSLDIHYKNNHNKRLWQDEFRFIVGECLRSMKTELDIEHRINVFNNLCNTLKQTLRGDNYSEELCIMNSSSYVLSSCIRDRIRMIQYFVNSPDFLFIGCSMELVCGIISPVTSQNGSSRLKEAKDHLSKLIVKNISTDESFSMLSNQSKELLINKLKQLLEENKSSEGSGQDNVSEYNSDEESSSSSSSSDSEDEAESKK